jgi:DMSO/TMAO reductase YedYZ heme-binding membrane subunit
VLALIHGGLLLFDDYVSYQIHQILIPFMGEYRPFAVGLGVITFWLMLIVASSFAFKKRLGHKWWKRLHYTSYAGFFMVTAHAYFAGTDADRFGFQILLGLAVMIVIVLTGNRMGAITKPLLESS